MSAEDANIRRPSPPRFSFSLSFPSWRRSSCYFNLNVFVLFVQEYGRKHGSELAEGQGEWQGEWQGGPYSIVQE